MENIEAFECKFISFSLETHVFKNPKLLPCNFSACSNCIEKSLDHFNGFLCKFCLQRHSVTKELPSDRLSLEMIRKNVNNILLAKVLELRKCNQRVKGKPYFQCSD
jgi:hypothetical protein